MKNRDKVLIILLIVVILIGGIFIYNKYFKYPAILPKLPELTEQREMTTDDYLEDFDYMYELLKEHYPYFDINKQVNGVDWLASKNKYREMISKCKTDDEFENSMHKIIGDLNNGHSNFWGSGYDPINPYYYYRISKGIDWRQDMAKIFEKPAVQNRYGITNEKLNQIAEEDKKPVDEDEPTSNLIMGNLNKDLGYIYIKGMGHIDKENPIFKKEKRELEEYLEEVKDCQALIVDIRGNGGGNSMYWSDFIFPLILDKDYSVDYHSFIKEGKLNKKVIKVEKFKKFKDRDLKELKFPEATNQIVEKFDNYRTFSLMVKKSQDSIEFDGNIYLLVDKAVYSSSEMLASFSKESGMCTLVGERTGGDGIGSDPMLADLPNTGYVIRFPKEMGVTESGSINEMDQTMPDILIDDSGKKIFKHEDEFFRVDRDGAIQAVFKEEGLKLE